jgi:hypothetical protein
MGYLIAVVSGIGMVVMVAGLALFHHHPAPPLPQSREYEEKVYGKGDRLFIHRDPPPPPFVVAPPPPPKAEEIEPPPKMTEAEPPSRKRGDICARTGGIRVEYNRGRSWHCKYHRHKR